MSPLTRSTACGLHVAAAVSIRTGRGSMTPDRVFRFAPLFDSHDEAASFAIGQALAWIDASPPQSEFSTTLRS